MKRLIVYIQQHLSLRLGLLILLVAGSVLGVTMGLLFIQTKHYVHQAAEDHAMQVLDETVTDISGIIERTEQATLEMGRRASNTTDPDSLFAITRQMVVENPVLQGFTIAFEAGFLDGCERFTTYSYRKPDSIYCMFKDDYEYNDDYWYKTPIELKMGTWLDPYEYAIPGIDTIPRYYFSFTAPIYGPDAQIIGVVCSDLSLLWLSQTLTAVKPFPNSSAIMLDHKGRYIVHPDTLKQVRESIFSDPDPQAREDVIPLGRSMISGQSGEWAMVVDGQPARLFYRPMEHTGWSIAIVCPDSDVFDSYNRMLNIVWAIIVLFLLLLLLSCYLIIRNAVVPINLLAKSSREITQTITKTSSLSTLHTSPSTWLGGMVSKRVDTIGQLQNSFVRMLQSLNDHVSELHHINAEMEQRNQELQQAYRLAREADERKTSFIQNMTHQVRTPLNIIIGFAQVIATNYPDMSETELTELFDHMKSSVKVVARIVHMLTATSVTNTSTDHSTDIACNTLCRDTLEAISTQVPAKLSVVVESTVSDDFTIRTDREALISILTELVINALRFTPEGSITIACCQQDDDTVLFTVTDTGMGISSENRECIFTPFIKLDSFTEGIGLGLPLSRHTAHLLGGDLTLDETYTDGTRFVLTLPIRH